MKRLVLAAVAVLALSGPAYANQCPDLMNKIDEALKTASVDADTKVKVEELRKTGEAQHTAGDHAASEASLNAALKLLEK
ncbi:MAG: hypothetical protein AB7S41_15280 [Parvibaculaceae bacterium]